MNASSASPVNFAPKHLSGIDVIDNAWGGLYRGGSYLVYGRAASGRGLLTLMFARTGAALGEPTLFISPDRQKDLMIQAASIGFNLRESYDSGIVRLVRVPPLMNLQNMGDDGVSKALWDLVTLIRQHRPTRLVMNDFMPFVAFRSYDRFRNEFIQFLEQIDSLDTTTVLVMPEPANEQSARVIEFMASQMTGSIRIELGEDSPTTTKRRISLIPHIGHIKRQVVDYWDLEDLVVQTQAAPIAPPAPEPEEEEGGLLFQSADDEEATTDVNLGLSPTLPMGSTPSAAPAQPTHSPAEPVQPEPAAPAESAPFSQPQQPFTQPQPPTNPNPELPEDSIFAQTPSQAPQQAPPQPATPFETSPPPVEPASTEPDYMDRGSFRARLDARFSTRDAMHQPFLLLALRMDRSAGQVRPFDFDFLMDLVRAELQEQDDMLVAPATERMVVFLGDSRAEEAQSFFARLKERLRQESPLQADHLLHSVSAIVVPDGRPFSTATEFLTYALDEG